MVARWLLAATLLGLLLSAWACRKGPAPDPETPAKAEDEEPPGPPLFADRLHGAARALGFVEVGGQGLEVSQQWSTRHGHSLRRGLPRAEQFIGRQSSAA